MHASILFAASLLSTTATNSTPHFSIGPWIIVPVLMVAALIAIPVYIVRDRRKRRGLESEWSKTDRR